MKFWALHTTCCRNYFFKKFHPSFHLSVSRSKRFEIVIRPNYWIPINPTTLNLNYPSIWKLLTIAQKFRNQIETIRLFFLTDAALPLNFENETSSPSTRKKKNKEKQTTTISKLKRKKKKIFAFPLGFEGRSDSKIRIFQSRTKDSLRKVGALR